MQSPALFAIEIVLGFVVPIGWAAWELLSLRRERERDRIKAEASPEASESGESGANEAAAITPRDLSAPR